MMNAILILHKYINILVRSKNTRYSPVILSDLEKMRWEKEKSMKKITYIDQKLGSGEMLKKN